MSSLAIDLGNTRLKAGIFSGDNLVSVASFNHSALVEGDEQTRLKTFLLKARHSDSPELKIKSILSSVISLNSSFTKWLQNQVDLIFLDHNSALPFVNLYKSPLSLGTDRIAAVAGAYTLYQGKHVLIINAGTAITYEILNEQGEYLGGSISPGIHMRYNALHTFTSRLPLLELDENIPDLIGTDTVSAIRSGVQLNTLFEIKEVISNYRALYGEYLTICICGGDSNTFVSQLKNSIFADHLAWQPDLVLIGLNKILTFNNA